LNAPTKYSGDAPTCGNPRVQFVVIKYRVADKNEAADAADATACADEESRGWAGG